MEKSWETRERQRTQPVFPKLRCASKVFAANKVMLVFVVLSLDADFPCNHTIIQWPSHLFCVLHLPCLILQLLVILTPEWTLTTTSVSPTRFTWLTLSVCFSSSISDWSYSLMKCGWLFQRGCLVSPLSPSLWFLIVSPLVSRTSSIYSRVHTNTPKQMVFGHAQWFWKAKRWRGAYSYVLSLVCAFLCLDVFPWVHYFLLSHILSLFLSLFVASYVCLATFLSVNILSLSLSLSVSLSLTLCYSLCHVSLYLSVSPSLSASLSLILGMSFGGLSLLIFSLFLSLLAWAMVCVFGPLWISRAKWGCPSRLPSWPCEARHQWVPAYVASRQEDGKHEDKKIKVRRRSMWLEEHTLINHAAWSDIQRASTWMRGQHCTLWLFSCNTLTGAVQASWKKSAITSEYFKQCSNRALVFQACSCTKSCTTNHWNKEL